MNEEVIERVPMIGGPKDGMVMYRPRRWEPGQLPAQVFGDRHLYVYIPVKDQWIHCGKVVWTPEEAARRELQ